MQLNRQKTLLVLAARRYYYASGAPIWDETCPEYAAEYSKRRVEQVSELIEALASPEDDDTIVALAKKYSLEADLKLK